MAAIALGLAGSALGPVIAGAGATAAAIGTATTIAGFVGGVVGGYIDQTYILPGLFPSEPIEGQRLGELQIQHSDEGAPINLLLGSTPRAAGAIIWLSDITEEEVEDESGGGKGGGGGGGSQVVGYNYYVSLAILISRNPLTRVRKILAEGKLLYNDEPDVAITSSAIAASKINFRTTRYSSSTVDLSVVAAGLPVTISGFGTAANNGTFNVLSSFIDSASGASYFQVANPSGVNESAGASVTISQTIPNFDPADVGSVTFYLGDGTQDPDPLIEANEGVGTVPDWRGYSYVVMERLLLPGRRIPQFQFLTEETTTTAAAGIGTVCTAAQITGLYTTSEVSASLAGYGIIGPQSGTQVLQPLMLANDILAQDTGSNLRFFDRLKAHVIDVEPDDLAAHESGSDAARPIEIEDKNDDDIPSKVIVTYQDSANEGETGSQQERRQTVTNDQVAEIRLPIVMSAGKARALARRVLYDSWATRNPVRLSLPPSYAHVLENDCLRFRTMDHVWFIRVLRVDFGANFVIEIEAVVEDRSVLVQTEEAEASLGRRASVLTPAPYIEPDTRETPPIDTPSTGVPTEDEVPVHFAGALSDPNVAWRGARVYTSSDDVNYNQITTLPLEAVIGEAVSVLASGPSSHWDNINTVDVFLFHGELSSRPEIEVLNGANRATLGTEIIGFKTATLVAERTYRLSGLLRGLRSTAVSGHANGDRFTLRTAAIQTKNVGLSALGTTRYVKIVGTGQVIEDVDAVSLSVTGLGLVPFAPADLHGFRNDDGDLVIDWKRRTRTPWRMFAPATPPIYEAFERYIVEAYDSGAVVRTWTVNDATTVTYTEAEQTTDGITHFDPVEIRVYQVSAIKGRGTALTGNI